MAERRPDTDALKARERATWDAAAAGWHKWSPLLSDWLDAATEELLDLAGVGPGQRVLDVAAGAGGQTLVAARRVGPGGRVLATDLSPRILAYVAEEAARAGLANVETRVMDAETPDVPAGSFDAALCRLGVMLMPNPAAALAGMKRAVKPGGAVAVIVFSTAERNPTNLVAGQVVRRRAGLGPPEPGQPGLFALGEPGLLERAYAAAGLHDVRTRVVEAAIRLPSAADYVAFLQDAAGAFHQMLERCTPEEREAAWAEVGEGLRRFEGPDGFLGPTALVLGVGWA
ncbi:MAG TPA: methyltransferase domain-containing protein [Chloroflexota bacterium]|nr:methyltransferase domain-containing protein [Chloroflexota bacterium]